MGKHNEAAIKLKIVIIGWASRLLIVLAAFTLYCWGGFLRSTFIEFICILLPLSCFYLTLFTKFIIRNAYRYQEQQQAQIHIHLGYYALLILNLAELALIVYKAFNFNPQISIGHFFSSLAGIEILFGLLAGFYISDLFYTKKPG